MAAKEGFKDKLLAFAERALRVAPHIKNEEMTKASLVQPFISLLGYDPSDPTELAAEHSADFSDKFKNKVDYAILKDNSPVIAIECKTVGASRKDDRGQLRSYFNAVPTIKLAILTDGLVFEFFVDSLAPNMMDEEPFLIFDAKTASTGGLSDNLIEGITAISKQNFDPQTIGDHAQQKMTYRYFYDYLKSQFDEPSVDFTRFLLKENEILHVRAAAIEGYRAIAKAAFRDTFNDRVLSRLDIADRSPSTATKEAPTGVSVVSDAVDSPGVVTTAKELEAFETTRRRLAYLAGGDAVVYDRISDVQFKDYQGKMVVFLDKERKGRFLEIYERKDGKILFVTEEDGKKFESEDISTIDDVLIRNFRKKVQEMSK